jgi:hypothetical protein
MGEENINCRSEVTTFHSIYCQNRERIHSKRSETAVLLVSRQSLLELK